MEQKALQVNGAITSGTPEIVFERLPPRSIFKKCSFCYGDGKSELVMQGIKTNSRMWLLDKDI